MLQCHMTSHDTQAPTHGWGWRLGNCHSRCPGRSRGPDCAGAIGDGGEGVGERGGGEGEGD